MAEREEEDSVIIRLKNICADLETVEVEAVIFFCDMRSSSVIPTFCGTAEVSDMARKSTAGEAFLAEFLRLCQVIHARKKEKILSIEQAATEHTGEGIPLEMSVDEVTNDDEKSLQPGGESHERRAAENRGQPLVQGSELLLDQKPPCAQTMCEQEGTKSSIDSVVNYNKDPTNSAKSIVRNDDVTVKREIISGESDYHETMSTTENEQNCQVRVKTEPVDPDDIVNFNTSEMTNTSKSDMSSGSQFSTAGNQHTAASTSSLHVPVTQVKTVKLIPRAAPEQGNSGGPVITPVDKNRMLVIHPMYGTTSLSNSPVPTNRVQSIAIKNVIPITSTTTDSSELSPRASSGVPSAASQTLALSQKGSTGQVANEMSENNKRSLIAKPSAVSVEPASKRFKPGTSEGRTTRRTPFRDKMTVSNVGSESEECVEKTGDISANSSHSSKMIDMGPRTRGQSKSVEEIESEKNPQRSSASSASRKQRIPSSPSDGASLSPGGTGNARAQSRTEHEATSEDDDDDDSQEDEEFNKLSSDDKKYLHQSEEKLSPSERSKALEKKRRNGVNGGYLTIAYNRQKIQNADAEGISRSTQTEKLVLSTESVITRETQTEDRQNELVINTVGEDRILQVLGEMKSQEPSQLTSLRTTLDSIKAQANTSLHNQEEILKNQGLILKSQSEILNRCANQPNTSSLSDTNSEVLSAFLDVRSSPLREQVEVIPVIDVPQEKSMHIPDTNDSEENPSNSNATNSSDITITEIKKSSDMLNVPQGSEVRICRSVQKEKQKMACSKGNYAWALAQAVFTEEELFGKNFSGKKGRQSLSPRRRSAIQRAFFDTYGEETGNFQIMCTGINTGIRNITRKQKRHLSRERIKNQEFD